MYWIWFCLDGRVVCGCEWLLNCFVGVVISGFLGYLEYMFVWLDWIVLCVYVLVGYVLLLGWLGVVVLVCYGEIGCIEGFVGVVIGLVSWFGWRVGSFIFVWCCWGMFVG